MELNETNRVMATNLRHGMPMQVHCGRPMSVVPVGHEGAECAGGHLNNVSVVIGRVDRR